MTDALAPEHEGLPPLPQGSGVWSEYERSDGQTVIVAYTYTAAQMHEYATAAVLAEREARKQPPPLTMLTEDQVDLWALKAGGSRRDGGFFFPDHCTFMSAAWACLQVQNPDLWCRTCARAVRAETKNAPQTL